MIFAKFMARFNKRGFTLIELIVVIAILAILAVTAVMAIGGVTDQARISTLQSDANTSVRALNLYNSLVASTGTKYDNITPPAYSDMNNLALEAPPDMIDMDLSVNITEERWLIIDGTNAIQGDPIIVFRPASSGVSNGTWVTDFQS
jgi:prepilin-type N-terminal cleavage/methylation domain-containing protein